MSWAVRDVGLPAEEGVEGEVGHEEAVQELGDAGEHEEQLERVQQLEIRRR